MVLLRSTHILFFLRSEAAGTRYVKNIPDRSECRPNPAGRLRLREIDAVAPERWSKEPTGAHSSTDWSCCRFPRCDFFSFAPSSSLKFLKQESFGGLLFPLPLLAVISISFLFQSANSYRNLKDTFKCFTKCIVQQLYFGYIVAHLFFVILETHIFPVHS